MRRTQIIPKIVYIKNNGCCVEVQPLKPVMPLQKFGNLIQYDGFVMRVRKLENRQTRSEAPQAFRNPLW